MSKLIEYIIALTNLYGMVHKEKVLEIYNSQNKNQIIQEVVDEFLTNPPEELENSFIYTHQDYFVHESILVNNEFDLILIKKGDKPYYIPEKNKLLKYLDEGYFEKTKQYNDLLKYLESNFFKDDKEKAEWLCEDIQGICGFGANMQIIFDAFNNRGISFKDLDQANEVMKLIMDLSNNIRIWENNGHTPQEIFERFEKPNLKPLPDKSFEFRSAKKEKIGRNAPCPCGSGKKYKKCCLRKENKR